MASRLYRANTMYRLTVRLEHTKSCPTHTDLGGYVGVCLGGLPKSIYHLVHLICMSIEKDEAYFLILAEKRKSHHKNSYNHNSVNESVNL